MKRLILTALILTSLACGGSVAVPTVDVIEAARQTMAAIPTPEQPTDALPPTPVPTDLPPTEAPLTGPASCIPNTQAQVGMVTNVVDGDTIDVLIDGQEYRVRYIGVDTPETKHPDEPVEYFGPEASEKNRAMVENQVVMLMKDISETDQYGRLLRYVFVGGLNGVFVNYELVRQGFANPVTYPPDVACEQTFRYAAEMARAEELGFWAPTPMPGQTPIIPIQVPGRGVSILGNVSIVTIFVNGAKGDKEPDEYVEIRNDSQQVVQLQGWTLVDEADHLFTFPSFEMQPGQVCRVYTDEVHPETCGFSFGVNNSAIWNNGGDCAYLRDSQHNLVDEYCY